MERLGALLPKLPAKPTTKQTWEGVEVVDYFKTHFDIPESGPWGYSSWLRRVKQHHITMHHAKKLVAIMLAKEVWLLAARGEKLERGKWMFNRFKVEIKEKGVDRFISANSK